MQTCTSSRHAEVGGAQDSSGVDTGRRRGRRQTISASVHAPGAVFHLSTDGNQHRDTLFLGHAKEVGRWVLALQRQTTREPSLFPISCSYRPRATHIASAQDTKPTHDTPQLFANRCGPRHVVCAFIDTRCAFDDDQQSNTSARRVHRAPVPPPSSDRFGPLTVLDRACCGTVRAPRQSSRQPPRPLPRDSAHCSVLARALDHAAFWTQGQDPCA